MTKLFIDTSGQYWTMAPEEMAKPGCKPMHAQGGGFLHQIPDDLFEEDFTAVEGFAQGLTKGKFSIDESPVFEGFASPARWNGWAMPLFEKDQMLLVVQAFHTEDYPMLFDEKTQTVSCFMQGPDDEEPEIYSKQVIEFEGKPLDVWALGSGSWTWEMEPATT